MNLVVGHDHTVAEWVHETYGDTLGGKPGFAWGVVDHGRIVGAFLVTREHNTTAELHVYGRVSNDTVRGMFNVVFRDLGVWRLQIKTSRSNKIVKKAAPKYGFKFEGVARDFYGRGDDALCFYMTPQHCRWINADIKSAA